MNKGLKSTLLGLYMAFLVVVVGFVIKEEVVGNPEAYAESRKMIYGTKATESVQKETTTVVEYAKNENTMLETTQENVTEPVTEQVPEPTAGMTPEPITETKTEEITEPMTEKNTVATQVPVTTVAETSSVPERVTEAETTVAPTEATISTRMSASDLEEELLNQPMYVVSTSYDIQSENYKTLYPDMLCAVIKNNSGGDVKTAIVAFAAWDKNNFPVKIFGEFDFEGSYIKMCNYGDVNMLHGDTYGEGYGMPISEDTPEIKTIKAIVVSYTDFDGNLWENPYYSEWSRIYKDKKLAK